MHPGCAELLPRWTPYLVHRVSAGQHEFLEDASEMQVHLARCTDIRRWPPDKPLIAASVDLCELQVGCYRLALLLVIVATPAHNAHTTDGFLVTPRRPIMEDMEDSIQAWAGIGDVTEKMAPQPIRTQYYLLEGRDEKSTSVLLLDLPVVPSMYFILRDIKASNAGRIDRPRPLDVTTV